MRPTVRSHMHFSVHTCNANSRAVCFGGNVTQNVTFVLLKQTKSAFNWGLSSVVQKNKCTYNVTRGETKYVTWKLNGEHRLKQANKDIPTFRSSPVIRQCFHEYSKLPPWLGLIIFMRIHTCSPLLQIRRIIAQCSVRCCRVEMNCSAFYFLFFLACCFPCYNFFNIQGTFISSTCSNECNSIQLSCHKVCNRDSTNNRMPCKTQIKPGCEPRQTSSAHGFVARSWANMMRLSILACERRASLFEDDHFVLNHDAVAGFPTDLLFLSLPSLSSLRCFQKNNPQTITFYISLESMSSFSFWVWASVATVPAGRGPQAQLR